MDDFMILTFGAILIVFSIIIGIIVLLKKLKAILLNE